MGMRFGTSKRPEWGVRDNDYATKLAHWDMTGSNALAHACANHMSLRALIIAHRRTRFNGRMSHQFVLVEVDGSRLIV